MLLARPTPLQHLVVLSAVKSRESALFCGSLPGPGGGILRAAARAGILVSNAGWFASRRCPTSSQLHLDGLEGCEVRFVLLLTEVRYRLGLRGEGTELRRWRALRGEGTELKLWRALRGEATEMRRWLWKPLLLLLLCASSSALRLLDSLQSLLLLLCASWSALRLDAADLPLTCVDG